MSRFNRGSSTTLARSGGATMLVAFAVVAVVLGANAFATSGVQGKKHRASGIAGLAVFSRGKYLARNASTRGAQVAPSGAVLAAASGGAEAYVSRNAEGEDCVTTITQGSNTAEVGCGQPTSVEVDGFVQFTVSKAMTKITALVPNGVGSVNVIDRDGSSHTVAVANNVAMDEDANASVVNYSTPDHRTHTTEIAKLLAHLPN